ncbi:MAG: hypothetical protein HOC24_14290 [Deltaproteobacteria bacterium]|jgi:hypothetical protein|nr:hypothetical protein [Deltaproteobacteria bacterium]
MSAKFILKQMPDQWSYRVPQDQFALKLEYVKNMMKQSLRETSTSVMAPSNNWTQLAEKKYQTDKLNAVSIFNNFCTVIAQALIFKDLHKYLFPYGRSHLLWFNSVLAKITGKTDREMFFLMAKNKDLLQESKKLVA